MIMRFTLWVGIVAVGIAWVLLVPLSLPAFQAVPESEIGEYRAAGLLPGPGGLRDTDEIDHDVFEVPDEDAEVLAAVIAEGGGMADMPGMDDMSGAPAEGMAEMGDMAAMAEEEGEEAENQGGDGLAVLAADAKVDRVITLDMREWGFRPGTVMVEQGETIRLVVRNEGQIPHEFMFMSMPSMAAINYRLERADWNLLEHEALYERPIIMPGDRFEAVLRIDRPGAWMFMCMFPYHMQFGMMGTLATAGMSMPGMEM